MRAVAIVITLLSTTLVSQTPTAPAFRYHPGEVYIAVEHTLQRETDERSGYAHALAEIQAGRKRSCWIWWIWPAYSKVRTTGKPEYSLHDAGAALAWLHHPTLGPRLLEITRAAVHLLEKGAPSTTVFGSAVDADKFHESVSLFAVASGGHPAAHAEGNALCLAALRALGRPIHAETARHAAAGRTT